MGLPSPRRLTSLRLRPRTAAALLGIALAVSLLPSSVPRYTALRLRRAHPALGDGSLQWLPSPEDTLVFAREPGFVCAVNLGPAPVELPGYGELLLASAPLTGTTLPPDTTAWFTG